VGIEFITCRLSAATRTVYCIVRWANQLYKLSYPQRKPS